NNVLPGGEVKVEGKGFSKEDTVLLKSGSSPSFTVKVTEVTDNYIQFELPKDAGGKYSVIIKRSGKETTIDGMLSVPYVLILDNVELPDSIVNRGSEIIIKGKGFEDGDSVQFLSDFYPKNKVIMVKSQITNSGIKLTIPNS